MRTRAAIAALVSLLGSQVARAQTDGTGATAIAVTPSFGFQEWIGRARPFELVLSPPLDARQGRLAVFIDSTDWTGLLEVSATSLRYQPRMMLLPRGEHTIVVYLVTPEHEWREIAQVPLRVLSAGGFEKIDTRPSVAVSDKGQLARGVAPGPPPDDRDTFQDVTVNLGLQSTLARAGWSMQVQSNLVGVTNQNEALRAGVDGEEAPRVDLADYLLSAENTRMALALGHVSFGASRHLVNAFASRGALASFDVGPAVDVSFAALNGSSVVGFSNFFGLDRREHRVLAGTVGAELMPSTPGAARISATVLDGSLLPLAGFTQGLVNDAETSRGVSIAVTAGDPRQRVRVDAGYARSRFDNPVDPLLAQGLSLVEVDATTRGARYVDARVTLVQGAPISPRHQANVAVSFRHERVEPLFRSVAAPIQADVLQNTVELSAGIGPMFSQVMYGWSHDNLAELQSVLTTRTRTTVWSTTVPIGQLVAPIEGERPWLPLVTYALNRVHQFGTGLPIGADFDSLSQVPDQVSLNQSAGATWQATNWRAGYQYNRSFQDNRQQGRELADLLNLTNTAAFGVMVPSRLDLGIELAWEGAENRELVETDVTRRWSLTVMVQPARRTSLTGSLTQTGARNEGETRERRTTDLYVQFAQAIALAPRSPDRLQGQAFVRFARQTLFSLDALFGLPPDEQRFWTVSTGVTFRVF